MRMKAAILATLVLVTAACSAAAPAPQQSTEADITLSGPVSITLWHALSGPQQKADDDDTQDADDGAHVWVLYPYLVLRLNFDLGIVGRVS